MVYMVIFASLLQKRIVAFPQSRRFGARLAMAGPVKSEAVVLRSIRYGE